MGLFFATKTTEKCIDVMHDAERLSHATLLLRIDCRQAKLGSSPNGTVPALDMQRPGSIQGLLGNVGLHGCSADDAVHGWRRWGVPADATNTDQGVRLWDIIDQGRVGAIG